MLDVLFWIVAIAIIAPIEWALLEWSYALSVGGSRGWR